MNTNPGCVSEAPTILIADDDADIRDLLVHRLTAAGYHVFCAVNGVEALSTIRAQHPRTVLLDVTMPLLSGLDVLRAMKAEPSLGQIPVILLTGRNDCDDVAKGREMGAVDYIVKPFSAKDLIDRIQNLTAGELLRE